MTVLWNLNGNFVVHLESRWGDVSEQIYWLEILVLLLTPLLIIPIFCDLYLYCFRVPVFLYCLLYSVLTFMDLIQDPEVMVQELEVSPLLDLFGQEFTSSNARHLSEAS